MMRADRASRTRIEVTPGRFSVRLAVLLLGIATIGCARNIAVQPPRPTFAIEVHNTFDVDMLVSYDAGGGIRALGAVTPGATERFVIAVPEAVPIQVTARSSDGSVVAGPFNVSLAPDVTRTVTLR
jgi:hypothetical protein